MSTAVHPEEVTDAVQLLIDERRFPAAGLTDAATSFLANALSTLQIFLAGMNSTAISRLSWGLASDTEGNLRSAIFSGSLSATRGEVVNDVLQETLIKLPYHRDDDNRRIGGPIPLFSIYELWRNFGGLLDWIQYRAGIPLTISGWFNQDRSSSPVSSPSRTTSNTITASEDNCGGILKLIQLSYPTAGSSPLRISVFGVPIDLNELRSHAGARGSEYGLTFSDGSRVSCNTAQFIQGFLSAAKWLGLDPSVYLSTIYNRAGQRCEIVQS